jgi:hypothetical protein
MWSAKTPNEQLLIAPSRHETRFGNEEIQANEAMSIST